MNSKHEGARLMRIVCAAIAVVALAGAGPALAGSDPGPAIQSGGVQPLVQGVPGEISGTLSVDTIWSPSGSPYLVGTLTVAAGVTLDVQPGVVVKFTSPLAGLDIHGFLECSNAVLTSYLDDTAGGDTNGDGGASVPGRGAWAGVTVDGGGAAGLSSVDIRYAGHSRAALLISGGALSLVGGSLTYSDDYALSANGAITLSMAQCTLASNTRGVSLTNCPVTLTGNTFQGGVTLYPQAGSYAAVLTDNNFGSGGPTLQFGGGGLALSGSGNTIGYVSLEGAVNADVDLPSLSTLSTVVGAYYKVPGSTMVTVSAGKTLSFPAGSTVKVGGSGYTYDFGFLVYGQLIAQGEPDAKIVFTSSSSNPQKGSWGGFRVMSGGTLTLQNAEVHYGGAYSGAQGPRALVRVSGGTANVIDSLLVDSNSYGVYRDSGTVALSGTTFERCDLGAVMWPTGSPLVMTGCTVRSAVLAYSCPVTLTGNTFQGGVTLYPQAGSYAAVLTDNNFGSGGLTLQFGGGGLALSGSGNNLPRGIGLSGSVGQDTSLPTPSAIGAGAYVVSSSLSVAAGSTLGLAPGTVLKFGSSQTAGVTVGGHLAAIGVSANAIYFTSWRDDSVGGDTDGSPSAPAKGDWSGVLLAASGTLDMQYAELRYGGYSGSGGTAALVRVLAGTANIAGCTLSNSIAYGVCVLGGTLQLTWSELTQNQYGLYISSFPATQPPVVRWNSFFSNGYGVYNAAVLSVDASNNWWGDPSGPRPIGLGDQAYNTSANLNVTPYLSSAPFPASTYFVAPVGVKLSGPYEYDLSSQGSPVSDPIWVSDGPGGPVTKDDPSCFKEGTAFSVALDVAGTSLLPPEGLALRVTCVGRDSVSGAVIVPEQTVEVTLYDWASQDYQQVSLSGTMPDCVERCTLVLWVDFYAYQDGLWVYQSSYETGPHVCYSVFSAPLPPMDVPWVEVIDLATASASGATEAVEIRNRLVSGLYDSQFYYSPFQYHSYPVNGTLLEQWFYLDDFLATGTGDCKDFANMYVCLASSLGVDVGALVVEGPFTTNPIKPAKWSGFAVSYWALHQFGWYDNLVYDASLKIDEASEQYVEGMDLAIYKAAVVAPGCDWTVVGEVSVTLPEPEGPPEKAIGFQIVLLSPEDFPEGTLVGTSRAHWATDTIPLVVTEQHWSLGPGGDLYVQYAEFPSHGAAMAGCRFEYTSGGVQLEPTAEKRMKLGQGSYCWPTTIGSDWAQMVFCTESIGVRVILIGRTSPVDPMLLLSVAQRIESQVVNAGSGR